MKSALTLLTFFALTLLSNTHLKGQSASIKSEPSNNLIAWKYSSLIFSETSIGTTWRTGLKQKDSKYPIGTYQAFFCRIENKLGKTAKLPLKIRLGDYDYVQKIEGKNAFDHFSLHKNY